jgi:hypothetical protein
MIGFVAALLVLTMVNSWQLSADTPVTALAADEVVLLLPVSPSVDRIVGDLHQELAAVSAATTDPRIAAALDRLADDDVLLRDLAQHPVDMFASSEAAATATPYFDVSLSKERVVVTAITIELVPGYGSTAATRDHEDGHALINEKIVKRCAREAFEYGIEHGYQGQALAGTMMSLLFQATDPVHAKYHSYVHHAGYGQHIAYAQQALDDVPGCSFSLAPSL